MLQAKDSNQAPRNEPTTRHCDLAIRGAQQQWRWIRWALFVFPEIRDVAPTDDPDVVRVFYEGPRPFPRVWAVELRQRGFDPAPGGLLRSDRLARRRTPVGGTQEPGRSPSPAGRGQSAHQSR